MDTTSFGHVRRIEALVDLINVPQLCRNMRCSVKDSALVFPLPAMYPPYPVIYSSYSSRLAAKGSLGTALATLLTD